ncbi:MAG: VOC family protein [Dehalococcoidales bacterium]|nr:VOC family protein [Dehalococcoidales bacterium]
MARTVVHVCILVKDINQAIERYSNIVKVASFQLLKWKVVRQERFAEDEKYITAFFDGDDGCDIQLLQPPDEQSPLYKRLQKHGEGVHHICFSSSHIEDTYRLCKEKGIAVNDRIIDERADGGDKTDIKHFWILPQYAHGVLIEVIDDYKVVDGFLKK